MIIPFIIFFVSLALFIIYLFIYFHLCNVYVDLVYTNLKVI